MYKFYWKTDKKFLNKLMADVGGRNMCRVDDDCAVMDIPQDKIAELEKVKRIIRVEVSLSWLSKNPI